MSVEFTKDQQDAVNAEGGILVSAAAGSGKTEVLTARVIRKLTDSKNPVSADRLLIVTFTNAAAAEMRSRIEKKLFDLCAKEPQNTNLIRQKHLIGSADICTIDSFCINLVRENFEKCGVEPDFKVSDGSEMLSESAFILDTITDKQIAENSQAFNKLLELTGCEYDDRELKNLVKELYLYSRQLPFPDSFFEKLVLPYKQKLCKEHPWYIAAKSLAGEALNSMNETVIRMSDTAQYLAVSADKCDNYVKSLAVNFDKLKCEYEVFDFDKFRETLYSFNVESIRLSSNDGTGGERFKSERKKFINKLDTLKALFSESTDEINSFNASVLPSVELLVDLIKEYEAELLAAFKEKNKLAFYHTEQMALELLCALDENGNISLTEEAKSYIGRYEEVMVDEFQDVNDLQNMLFDIISDGGKKLFVVGDIKQSIYRFRGSNLNNFSDKKKTYIPIGSAADDGKKKIILSDNFRSRIGICEFVNFMFLNLMTSKTGQISYDEEERLNPAAEYSPDNRINTELLIVDKGEADEAGLYEYESSAIAEYIKNAVNEKMQITDKNGEMRDISYGDFCILLDKMSIKSPVLVKALSDNGIPVSLCNEAFCKTPEISLMLSLLTVLDNPARDVELLTVMMSPIYGFTADEIALMRANQKDGDIYKTVIIAANSGNEKAKNFLFSLSKLRNSMAILPLDKLIMKLINDMGLLAIVSAGTNGKQRRSNLLSLPSFAEDFKYSSVSEFIKHITSLPENSFKTDAKHTDFVSVMSMHKSKGLQFPVCILSDLSSRINNEDSISPIVFSEKSGIGFRYFDESEKLYNQNLGRKIISKQIFGENIEEKLRLLYVAATRAKEKLVMVSAIKNSYQTLNRIAESIENKTVNPEFVRSSSSLGDLVLACCLLHPDGDALRDLGEINLMPQDTESRLSVKIADCSIKDRGEELKNETVFANNELKTKIEENLSYVYPFEELSSVISKTSVSAVAKSAESEEYYFSDRPSFMNENGMSSAKRGTAIHTVMQFMEFSNNPDVEAEIERLTEWQFITEQQAKCADVKKIEAFFASPLYKRILNANFVKREMRFLTKLPAQRIDENVNPEFADTPVIVQGAVDLLFDEDDGMVVVDFKTDRVKNAEDLKNTYGEQLNIYSEACEKILGKPVKQRIIYSFELNSSTEV